MSGFIHYAFALDECRRIDDPAELAQVLRDPTPGWIHMQADDPRSREWVEERLGYLPGPVREALLATGTRPRVSRHGDGVMLILRGVNTNPGAEPEDMVSLRLWVEAERVVSLSVRDLAAVHDIADELAAGDGPRRADAFIAEVVERLSRRLSDYADALDVEGDELEKRVLAHPDPALRKRVTDIRGELVDLRQFLIPQREVLARLAAMDLPFMQGDTRLRLAEGQEAAGRTLEVVESLRERLVVLKDELSAALDDRLNRNLYRLSVISVVFLPLGVLTGLLGVNLAGIPGANSPPAFWTFTGGLVALGALLVGVLRWVRWL